MGSILLAVGAAIAYIIAYNTYGKFLARKIFNLDETARTPAVDLNDNMDYVPTKKDVLFGHHFTSIAGTGPIVGPAIGIIWGWVPALIWVVFGSILMGAVHDFGSIVISLRNQGKSVGDIAASLISPRVRLMFLSIIFIILLMVIAIFCLVISVLFKLFPQAVLSIWMQIPISIWLGHVIYTKKRESKLYVWGALLLMYISVIAGAWLPFSIETILPFNPVVSWTVILLIYAFIASTLPVWRLLQPRDYINGYQLLVAMGLLAAGVIFAHPVIVAPALNLNPEGAPPIFPFLFITIACGALSGFHSLVGSGTTAKQMSNESHAKVIGYGGMLMEGMLAIFALIAVGAGIGLAAGHGELSGVEAWTKHYASWGAAQGLGSKVSAFVTGSANMLTFLGISFTVGTAIMGVFVASFAGTTLDTATRLQRYVIAELSASMNIKFFTGKYAATGLAVVSAGLLALWDGEGKGGLLLWPLFGASNQLLGTLALLVITVYLAKNKKPVFITLIPFLFMLVVTGWAMLYQLKGFIDKGQIHLLTIDSLIIILEVWMIVEAVLAMRKYKKSKS
ncbi:MAG: carbon starvation protein A [Fibrobacteria bacterium]|nr:carbon starvation protein A [Fibrobacteria bacterium]